MLDFFIDYTDTCNLMDQFDILPSWWICNTRLIARNPKGRLTLVGRAKEREEWKNANEALLMLDEEDRVVRTSTHTRLALCKSGLTYRWNSKGYRVVDEELGHVTLARVISRPFKMAIMSRREAWESACTIMLKWNPDDKKAVGEKWLCSCILCDFDGEEPIRRWRKTLDIVDYNRKYGYVLTSDGRAYNIERRLRKLVYQKIQMRLAPRKSANSAC